MKSLNEEVYSSTKDLANDLGVKTAYDDLSSDVNYFYPTGVKPLDIVIGGGVPSGKVIELFGWESCFTGDTLVYTVLNGYTKIEDLVGIDKFEVYSCNPNTGETVIGIGHNARITRYVNSLYQITLSNGEVIKCTEDHRFMLDDLSYREAQHLKIGNVLKSTNRSLILVSKIEILNTDVEPMYDIEVDEYHNFALSAGIFVHNSGKSALALTFSKAFTEYWENYKTKCVVLWIEAESAFDKMRARYFGCNLDHYMIVEALDIEEAFKKMEDAITMASKKDIKLFIVLDTIAALQTSKERVSGEFAGGIAQKPRVVKQCLQKLVPLLGDSDTTLVLVNQVYSTLNAYGGASFDSPGGGGIKFFSSIRGSVTVKRKDVEFTPSGEEVTKGIVTEIFTKKNKITLPQQKCMIYLYGDKGIDIIKTLYELMVKNKIFTGAAWKSYSSMKKMDDQYIPFEIKFQNIEQLVSKADVENIDIVEYLNYETTKIYSMSSPFIKVKYIEDLWNFEIEHFGKKNSTLTDEERDLAKLIFEKFADDGGDDGEPMESEWS